MTKELKTRIDDYVKLVQKLNDTHWGKMGFIHAQSPLVVIEEGTRYIKVLKQDRTLEGKLGAKYAHTFIDKTNGDVLKAATYKAPAKNGVRGNIFNENIKDVIDHFGAKYLR
jgi:hypothetical protein